MACSVCVHGVCVVCGVRGVCVKGVLCVYGVCCVVCGVCRGRPILYYLYFRHIQLVTVINSHYGCSCSFKKKYTKCRCLAYVCLLLL